MLHFIYQLVFDFSHLFGSRQVVYVCSCVFMKHNSNCWSYQSFYKPKQSAKQAQKPSKSEDTSLCIDFWCEENLKHYLRLSESAVPDVWRLQLPRCHTADIFCFECETAASLWVKHCERLLRPHTDFVI